MSHASLGSIGRRDLMRLAAGALAAPAFPKRPSSGLNNVLEPFNYSGVRLLDSMFQKQCVYARNLFLGIPEDDLLLGFRQRAGLPAPGKPMGGWYSDTFHAFGQYLSGMARLSKGLDAPKLGEKARSLMLEWGKTIDKDGYFYYSRKPNSYTYIYDKTMCGLVDLYEYGGHQEALPLMEKITRWAAANLNRREGEWYTLSENLYRAYQLTGDPQYKKFGDAWHYPEYWDMFGGKAEPTPFGRHAYSHVNTFSSAAMTYEVTGEEQYLKTIVNAFDWLERTQMYATGGYGPAEKLMAPDGSLGKSLETTPATFETVCGSWAGFKLARYLIRFTGEARYGDWIEKLLYNGIGAALPLLPDGANFYYSDYTLRGARKVYHPQTWTCCSGTYPQAIADYHNIVYFKDSGGLYVNLFVPSEVTWSQGGIGVKLTQETSYPETDTTTLTVLPAQADSFDIKFRVPRWSQGVTAEVNGQPVSVAAKPGTWAAIRRTWNPGDRVKIRIPMQLAFAPVDRQHPNRVALTYGPVVLVRRSNPPLVPGKGDPGLWIAREGSGLDFRMEKQQPGVFTPFYKMGFGEGYQMYFDLAV